MINARILLRLLDNLKTSAAYNAMGILEPRSFVDQFIFELIVGLRGRKEQVLTGSFKKSVSPESMLQSF